MCSTAQDSLYTKWESIKALPLLANEKHHLLHDIGPLSGEHWRDGTSSGKQAWSLSSELHPVAGTGVNTELRTFLPDIWL